MASNTAIHAKSITLGTESHQFSSAGKSFHVSMAALEPSIDAGSSSSQLTSVVLLQQRMEFMLCSLEHGRVYQQALDLNFTEGEQVTFCTRGKGIVHLTGYWHSRSSDDESENYDRGREVVTIENDDQDSVSIRKRHTVGAVSPSGTKKTKFSSTVEFVNADSEKEEEGLSDVSDADETALSSEAPFKWQAWHKPADRSSPLLEDGVNQASGDSLDVTPVDMSVHVNSHQHQTDHSSVLQQSGGHRQQAIIPNSNTVVQNAIVSEQNIRYVSHSNTTTPHQQTTAHHHSNVIQSLSNIAVTTNNVQNPSHVQHLAIPAHQFPITRSSEMAIPSVSPGILPQYTRIKIEPDFVIGEPDVCRGVGKTKMSCTTAGINMVSSTVVNSQIGIKDRESFMRSLASTVERLSNKSIESSKNSVIQSASVAYEEYVKSNKLVDTVATTSSSLALSHDEIRPSLMPRIPSMATFLHMAPNPPEFLQSNMIPRRPLGSWDGLPHPPFQLGLPSSFAGHLNIRPPQSSLSVTPRSVSKPTLSKTNTSVPVTATDNKPHSSTDQKISPQSQMPANSKISIGATFVDYKSFMEAFRDWCEENFHPMSIRTSHRPRILVDPTRYPYDRVMFTCKHYGKPRTKKATENPQSYARDCPVVLTLTLNDNTQYEIKWLNTNHNHIVSAEYYRSYPYRSYNHRLTDEEIDIAVELLQQDICMEEMQQQLSNITGKLLNPRYLLSLKAKLFPDSPVSEAPSMLSAGSQVVDNRSQLPASKQAHHISPDSLRSESRTLEAVKLLQTSSVDPMLSDHSNDDSAHFSTRLDMGHHLGDKISAVANSLLSDSSERKSPDSDIESFRTGPVADARYQVSLPVFPSRQENFLMGNMQQERSDNQSTSESSIPNVFTGAAAMLHSTSDINQYNNKSGEMDMIAINHSLDKKPCTDAS